MAGEIVMFDGTYSFRWPPTTAQTTLYVPNPPPTADEVTALYAHLGQLRGIGEVAAAAGMPTGAELTARVDAIAESAAIGNPAAKGGSPVSRVRAAAGEWIRSWQARPRSILIAIGLPIGLAWVAGSTAVDITTAQAQAESLQQGLALLPPDALERVLAGMSAGGGGLPTWALAGVAAVVLLMVLRR